MSNIAVINWLDYVYYSIIVILLYVIRCANVCQKLRAHLCVSVILVTTIYTLMLFIELHFDINNADRDII